MNYLANIQTEVWLKNLSLCSYVLLSFFFVVAKLVGEVNTDVEKHDLY